MMPKYAELTGKDKEIATKLQKQLVSIAGQKKVLSADETETKAKYAKIIGEADVPVDVDGGKVSCTESSASVTQAVVEKIMKKYPPKVHEAAQQTTISLSAATLEEMSKHADAEIRDAAAKIKTDIEKFKKAELKKAKDKGNGAHLSISVTAPKS